MMNLTRTLGRLHSGLGWWGALVLILAFAVVAKTSTVGAPVQASTVDAVPRERISRPSLVPAGPTFDHRDTFAGRSLDLEAEVESLRSALAIERRKSALLEKSIESLTEQVEDLAASPTPDLPAVPTPVEAIYVRPANR